jgi:hypothetical protein
MAETGWLPGRVPVGGRPPMRLDCPKSGLKWPAQRIIPAAPVLAFTLAPHLQPINHRDCFSPFGGI